MNIIYKLTLRHMRLNKKRTMVTLLGIIISVAMYTAVSVIVFSFQDVLIRNSIALEGKWHATYSDVNPSDLDVFGEDSRLELYMLSNILGYSMLENEANSNKPYTYVEAYDDDSFENMPVNLVEGRLPTSDKELLIPEYFSSDSELSYGIGDTITLTFGERILSYEDAPDEETILGQSYGYMAATELDEGELFVETGLTREYTIVGIMERLNTDHNISPGYSMLTYLEPDNITKESGVNVSVYLKDPGGDGEALDDLSESVYGKPNHYVTNFSLLAYSASTYDSAFNDMLFILAAILFMIIMIGSISLIYNAFAISIAERSKYLGMVASVGATKKQKQSSVFFESFVVGSISIVFGIAAGILGIAITFYLLNPIMQNTLGLVVPLKVVVSIPVLLLTTVMSIITIFLSAYIPARKASKISPIDAIRQTSEIKLKAKNVRTLGITRKIFGFESELALKNLKRFKGRYRATVFSLVISIILFLAASSYVYYLQNGYAMTSDLTSYDAYIWGHNDSDSNDNADMYRLCNEISEIDTVENCILQSEFSGFFEINHQDSMKYLSTEMKNYTENNNASDSDITVEYIQSLWEDYRMYFNIVTLDAKSFSEYAKEVNYTPQTDKLNAIVVNKTLLEDGLKKATLEPMDIKAGDTLSLYYDYWYNENVMEDEWVSELLPFVSLHVSNVTDVMPGVGNPSAINIIVSEETMSQLLDISMKSEDESEVTISMYSSIYIKSSNPGTLDKTLESVLGKNRFDNYVYYNIYESQQRDAQAQTMISVFAYGFIFLISCICIANSFNTVSTNISLRRREFAILRSTGMTSKAFNKMINFESLFYGIKALLYGLPISFGIMVLIYRTTNNFFYEKFTIPWVSVVIAMVSVFLVVGSAMLYSTIKVKKENVIDGLKTENI